MIYPPSLKFNDKVVIIAPAGRADKTAFQSGLKILKSWGLNPVIAKYAQGEHNPFYTFSGNDEQRLADIQTAIDEVETRAIICVRGGYGTNRIIDKIDFSSLKSNPKWIVGFSDITVLHCHLNKLKLASVHGMSANYFDIPNNEIGMNSLKKVLFGEQNGIKLPCHPFNREGAVKAEIIGGNLTILTSLIGTDSDFDTNNKILFIEEIGETPYRLDRALEQLRRAGKFDNLVGLIIGDLEGAEENKSLYRQDLLNLIVWEKVKDKKYPVCFDFPVGHQPANFAMICGAKAELIIEKEELSLNFDSQKSIESV